MFIQVHDREDDEREVVFVGHIDAVLKGGELKVVSIGVGGIVEGIIEFEQVLLILKTPLKKRILVLPVDRSEEFSECLF